VVRSDHNDNIMPSKKHSAGRIDGIVATIIALSRCIANGGGSVYDKRGIIWLQLPGM
jgi:phage terminase large subunit-like protein